MPQTGPFVLRGDRRRAAWRMVGYGGGYAVCWVAAWVMSGMKAPEPLLLALVVGIVVAIVLSHLLHVISRPAVVADDTGIWLRKQSLWHAPSERFLPWDEVSSVDVLADQGGVNRFDLRTNYVLRIVPRDVAAAFAAHPAYEDGLCTDMRVYGAPYVVQLGYRDGADVRKMNHHWDEIRPELEKVMPGHVPFEWITITT